MARRGGDKRSRGKRVPGLAAIAGTLVCLVNPNIYGVFRVPAELAVALQPAGLVHDSLFAPLMQSPLQSAYYLPLRAGNPSGVATVAVLLGGLVAVALVGTKLRASRLLVCAGLLTLGLIQARNLPFLLMALAVLAPRACLEFSDAYFRDKSGAELRLHQAITGRLGTLVLLLAAIAVAWTGRMQAGVPEARAWFVETDPSLVQAAEQVAQWRMAGKLSEQSHGFNFSPEIANYFAWHCPQEKGFLNGRLLASAQTISEYAAVRQGLMGIAPDAAADDWRKILRSRGIDHLVLADKDWTRMQRVLQTVFAARDEWSVLLQSGRVLVLGWRDPERPGMPRVAWEDTALQTRGLCPSEAERAPAKRVRPPQSLSWWQALAVTPSKPSLDRDEAALCLAMYDVQQPSTARHNARAWEVAQVTAGLGSLAASDPAEAALRLGWQAGIRTATASSSHAPAAAQFALWLQHRYCLRQDDAPPGYLWAAIRAGRRAVATDPQDADGYLLLGRAYCHLVWNSPERMWGRALPLLMQMRKLQAIAALQQAVRLRPDLERGHQLLIAMYRDAQYLDLALRHSEQLLKLATERGAAPNETAEQFSERLGHIREVAEAFRQDVATCAQRYGQNYQELTLAARARLAERLGLAEKALDLLLASDVAAFGKDGMQIELEMLLSTGRIEEAGSWLEPQQLSFLGEFNYRWLQARMAAAEGNYEVADEQLREMTIESVNLAALKDAPVQLERGVAISFAANVINGAAEAIVQLPHAHLLQAATGPRFEFQTSLYNLRRTAELALMRGVLALEQGDLVQADRHLGRALALTPTEAADLAPDTNIRPAVLYYQGLRAAGERKEFRR
jgi:hypothetical protein